MTKKTGKKLFKLFIVILIYVAIGGLFLLIAKLTGFNADYAKSLIDSHREYAWLIFVGLQFISSIIFLLIPGKTFTFIVIGLGFFSPTETFVLVSIGTLLVSTLYYLLGRYFSKFFAKIFLEPETKDKYLMLFKHKASVYYPIVMLLPFFPDDQLTMVAGMSKMNFWYFIVSTLIFRSIGVATITYFGGSIPWSKLSAPQAILLALVVIFAMIEIFTFTRQVDKTIAKRASIAKKEEVDAK
jgi:uncharacterized membrane protein YdjX (TVP38/TMEM64 family)